jgi:hypothetical protein
MLSTSANSSRLTFVNSSGLYVVGANITWSSQVTGGGPIYLALLQNDTNVIAELLTQSTNNITGGMSINTLVQAASSADYITVRVRQNLGSTQSIAAHSASTPVRFWATFMST